eukprot:281536-Pleurochrysis_carterae.AAC.1
MTNRQMRSALSFLGVREPWISRAVSCIVAQLQTVWQQSLGGRYSRSTLPHRTRVARPATLSRQ